MARYKGHEGAAEIGSDPIGEIESFDVEITSMELDANTMGNDWTNVEGGQKSASGTINVLTDPDDTGQTAMTAGATVALTLFPVGNTTGLTTIAGDFLVTSEGRSSSVGDLVKTTYSVRNQGTVTVDVVV